MVRAKAAVRFCLTNALQRRACTASSRRNRNIAAGMMVPDIWHPTLEFWGDEVAGLVGKKNKIGLRVKKQRLGLVQKRAAAIRRNLRLRLAQQLIIGPIAETCDIKRLIIALR